MELFKRNPFVRSTIQETEVETVTSFAPVEAVDSEETPRNWLMLASLVVAAIAFTILVVMTATWLYHKVHTPAGPSNSAQTMPNPPPQDLKPDSF